MLRTLATLFALLAVVQAQDKPPEKPVEDFAEIKWDLQKDDRLEFKWTLDDSRKQTHAINVKTAVVEETTDTADRREVTGEIWLKEGENGNPAKMVLTLKKAVWCASDHDHDITVTYDGKKVDLQTRIKGDPTANAQAKENYKLAASLIGEGMKKGVEGEFTVFIDTRRTDTLILKDGHPTKPGPSLFDKIYLHAPIPNQLMRLGQTWREKVDSQLLPSGLVDACEFEYKVTAVNSTNANFKAAFQVPIARPPAAGDPRAITTTGSFGVVCDFVWNRAGYLQTGKQEVTFTKKVDAVGKDAKFYRESANWSIKQAVTIKRKAPAAKPEDKGDEKKDEKKPGEKKPPEKK